MVKTPVTENWGCDAKGTRGKESQKEVGDPFGGHCCFNQTLAVWMVCSHAEWGKSFCTWSVDSNVHLCLIQSSSDAPSDLSSPAIWAALGQADKKNCHPCGAGRICFLGSGTWAVQRLFPVPVPSLAQSITLSAARRATELRISLLHSPSSPPQSGQNTVP